jgi:hypothetical protein
LALGRFAEYRLKSRIVAEKYARYYVAWVRKFLAQIPEKDGVTWDDRLRIFLENLGPTVEPWQLDQAEKAVRLYFSTYLTTGGTDQEAAHVTPDAEGRLREADVLAAVRPLIRLRHYSYRTEQTYLDWLDRFFRYLASRKAPVPGGWFCVTPQHVKDYPARSPLDLLRSGLPAAGSPGLAALH